MRTSLGAQWRPRVQETEILHRSVRLDSNYYVPPQLRLSPLQLQDYLTVRPFKTIPEGSVHVHGSPAGPKPYGQRNLPTLHSRSEISSIRPPKNPRRSSVWRRDPVVVLVVAQDSIKILTEIKSQRGSFLIVARQALYRRRFIFLIMPQLNGARESSSMLGPPTVRKSEGIQNPIRCYFHS